jgi:hypothetical protein
VSECVWREWVQQYGVDYELNDDSICTQCCGLLEKREADASELIRLQKKIISKCETSDSKKCGYWISSEWLKVNHDYIYIFHYLNSSIFFLFFL